VQDRLDEVVGIGNWQACYKQLGATLICQLSLRVNGEWISKEDGGADADDNAHDQDNESKGALSQALKRAGVAWGIGRYLYRLPKTWVPVEKVGKSCVIKQGCEPTLPDWALPEGYTKPAQQHNHTQQQAPAAATNPTGNAPTGKQGNAAPANNAKPTNAAPANTDTPAQQTPAQAQATSTQAPGGKVKIAIQAFGSCDVDKPGKTAKGNLCWLVKDCATTDGETVSLYFFDKVLLEQAVSKATGAFAVIAKVGNRAGSYMVDEVLAA
jgi:hypothetical protein